MISNEQHIGTWPTTPITPSYSQPIAGVWLVFNAREQLLRVFREEIEALRFVYAEQVGFARQHKMLYVDFDQDVQQAMVEGL